MEECRPGTSSVTVLWMAGQCLHHWQRYLMMLSCLLSSVSVACLQETTFTRLALFCDAPYVKVCLVMAT